MNRKMKAASLLTVLGLVSGALAGCGGNSDNGGNSGTNGGANTNQTADAAKDPVTLKIMLWGDKPKQFDDVIAEFEKETKDTLNVKLDVTWTPQADYVNKLKLKLAAGEQVDLAFDAPWMNMNQFIQQDNYNNLDPYFHTDKYPGLKKAFTDQYLNNNMFMGTDKQLHVYGVPMGQYYTDLSVIYYRKDLAKKYGMSDLQSYDDLIKYFDNVKQNDPSIIPFVEKNDGNYGAVDIVNGTKATLADKAAAGLWDVPLAPQVTGTVLIKDNKVVAASITGEKSESKQAFPEPYNQEDNSTFITVRDFHDKGYTEKEPITRKDAKGTFTAGTAASMMENISNLDSIQSGLKAAVPSAEIGMLINSASEREMKQPSMVTDFRVWNFLCVPKTSKNLDRVMEFLNWMYSSQDNHDLFELGVKGKNWEPVGDDKYKIPDGVDLASNYTFPGYEFTWNPTYIRLSANVPDGFVKYYRYMADEKSFVKSALAGFAFNGDPVKNQLSNPDFGTIQSEKLPLQLGMMKNPADDLAKLQQKWEGNKTLQSDIQAIKDELLKQVQAFLDTQKAAQ
ncbi:putative aldouronate transport system substrate-binding protein [Paenibacillus taihuensis]|uniref:Putative aldouronate transport system substrate-binding protein n=1 Tax=Paenibacillus taihuensis TaxID=1156355 RepID=A0A3D9RHS1_9BACL|nr:extracellular solute-binding protein [Paenibacillus taihuensis]REE78652.1 putative aldouronate transport system substrate-binding protein [Paenibacillus taihuensis]